MQDYDEIIKNLFARHQSVQNAGFNPDSYKPGLDRIRGLDRKMGNPSEHLRFVHVAGTNGKGSVCSMLAASLSGNGYRVGLFTSPHLLDFRERIKIVEDGGCRMIPRESVLEFLEKYDSPDLSFFEITTGLALWYFDRCQVDIAVLEVGLGGLLDSTNIVVPEISVVTSIGLDHCALLGDTRALIAGQKAGIFKSGVPAVVGERDDETAPVFEAAAAAVHCPLFFADNMDLDNCLQEYLPENRDNNRLNAENDFQAGTPADILARMDLKGEWQGKNLRTVLCALDLLGEEPDFEAITHAAAITGLHGRWETVGVSPLTIADIGHNPAALKENFARLRAEMDGGAYDKLLIVYGIMADKDLDGIIPLMPPGAEYFFAAPDTPRALPATEILSRFAALRQEAAVACDSVDDAVKKARAVATPKSLIYVGGSAFVVADCLKFLQSSKND
ncbi:MAG: bifunctional folylpolyglutamate synthase/dihydrofolate synthase [Bacteroidales bacterium]|nr:bifunctional folylpolyglutamate synthase/dihydrofolate synthase [Bacteroidales bacterium]MBP5795869.1 bifunctional folylpolyglutamate synthase/dihydrofolate synthase [Bacteroidales bacterium]